MRSVRVDGQKLKRFRERSGLTQTQLAQMLGYSDRLIRKMERGGPISPASREDVLLFWQDYFFSADTDSLPSLNIDLFGNATDLELERQTRRWLEGVYTERNLGLIEKLVHHEAALFTAGKSVQGRDRIRQHFKALFSAFKSISLAVEHVHVEATSVIVFWKAALLPNSEVSDHSLTGPVRERQGSSLFEFKIGLIREIREHWSGNGFDCLGSTENGICGPAS